MDRQNPMLIERPTIRNIALTGLPVGASYDFTFPADKLSQLLSVRVVFDTDSNVADRRVVAAILNDGGVQYANFPAPFTQAADQIYVYTWAPGMVSSGQAITNDLWCTGFPTAFILQPSWELRIMLLAVQVGDQIDNLNIVWKEWQLPVWP